MINTRRGDFSGGRVLLLKIHRRMPGLHARAVRKARFPSVHTSPEALMATDDSLSAASTPDRSSEARRHVHAGFEKVVSLRLRDGEEVFTVSPPAGVQLGNREARAVLEGEGHLPDFPPHHADTPCCASSQAHAVNWSAAS